MLDDIILPEEELDEFGNPLPPKKTSRVAAFLSDDDETSDEIPEEIEESPDDYAGLSDGNDEPTGDY